MEKFTFDMKTVVYFGENQIENLKDLLKENATKVLLHYGGGSIKENGIYDKVIETFKEINMPYVELSGVKPNPRLSLVHEGIDIVRRENIDFILAVGGGSVIDSAKAIGMGVNLDEDVWNVFTGDYKGKITTIPVGTILTIPAAGSEMSPSTVITNEEKLLKKGYTNQVICPVFSILDPTYTYTLPAYQSACGISDILAHMFERYFTKSKDVEISDRLLEGNIVTVLEFAPKVLENPTDYHARSIMMWAGTIAHNNMLAVDRIGDWGTHSIEHELSAIYDIPHGEGLAIIFPAWMKYNYKKDIKRFVRFATNVFNVSTSNKTDEEVVLEMIDKLEQFYKSIGLATRLNEVNIDESRLVEMANKCRQTGACFTLNASDIESIYELAL